jgi:hypothetical protein
MDAVEEEHALNLIFGQLSKLKKGEKLKVAMDVDDTVAEVSPAVKKILEEKHGLSFGGVGRHYNWYRSKTTDRHFLAAYNELWSARWKEIKPLLSPQAFLMLSERTDFSFISARGKEAGEPLYRWVLHHYGKRANVSVVEANPYSMHGIKKMDTGYDLLVDDSPHVSSTMEHELAKGKALLLIDKWDEALKQRNRKNTAVVANAEHAADLIFDAHEVHSIS